MLGIKEGRLLGSGDSLGANEGELLGSEDLLGANEGRLLGSDDSLGANEGKWLGSEDDEGAEEGSDEGVREGSEEGSLDLSVVKVKGTTGPDTAPVIVSYKALNLSEVMQWLIPIPPELQLQYFLRPVEPLLKEHFQYQYLHNPPLWRAQYQYGSGDTKDDIGLSRLKIFNTLGNCSRTRAST